MIIKVIRVDSRFYWRKNQNRTDKKLRQNKSNMGKKRYKLQYDDRGSRLMDIDKVQKKGNKQKWSPEKEKWFKDGVCLGCGR